jgi:hypothetical protein
MEISLEQAIGIHARALKGRAGKDSPRLARRRASDLRDMGDHEGFRVWMLVGDHAARLLAAQAGAEQSVQEVEPAH